MVPERKQLDLNVPAIRSDTKPKRNEATIDDALHCACCIRQGAVTFSLLGASKKWLSLSGHQLHDAFQPGSPAVKTMRPRNTHHSLSGSLQACSMQFGRGRLICRLFRSSRCQLEDH